MRNEKKLQEAQKIIERERKTILETLLKTSKDEFQNDRCFFPLYEEGAKYDIKKLKLDREQEKHFISQITETYGPYSDDELTNNPKQPYYTNFYQK